MQDRVSQLVGGSQGRDIWVSTFHSMCVRILRRDIERIGFTSNFSILDSSDQLSVIRSCMKDQNIDTKKFEPKAVQAMMSTAKNELIGPEQYEKQAGDYFEGIVAKVYKMYQKRLEPTIHLTSTISHYGRPFNCSKKCRKSSTFIKRNSNTFTSMSIRIRTVRGTCCAACCADSHHRHLRCRG